MANSKELVDFACSEVATTPGIGSLLLRARSPLGLLTSKVAGQLLDQADSRVLDLLTRDLLDRAFGNAGAFGDLRPASFAQLQAIDDVLVKRFGHGPAF